MRTLAVVILVCCSALHPAAEAAENANLRPIQQAEVDDMVNNILQWLQGVYKSNNRKARQQGREYLPPSGKPEKPRPFQPPGQDFGPGPNGYAPAGFTPSPSYDEGPSQPPIYVSPGSPRPLQPIPNQPPSQTPYQPSPSLPPYQPSPSQPPYQPSPSQPPYQPSPSQPPYQPSPSQPPYQPSPSQPPYQPVPTQPPYQPSPTPYQPSPTQPPYQPSPTQPPYQPQPTPVRPIPDQPNYQPSPSENNPSNQQPSDDSDRHPPHIHAMDVDCAKDMMTINIEFNKIYNGVIYSKGFYNNPDCIYVHENSNQIKYSFTVSLNSCGTEFINGFETQGQSYLENVLVLQNEAGIQEVWDSIRSVRCLWEGNLKKQLSTSLTVGMLNQEIVSFSGDTAMTSLDIQIGRGPFAPQANGLIKIGETMTLVISVRGDPEFDIQVKECTARDSDYHNVVPLTDENGCVLKPKVFGAFQKTKDTGNTGASIIAYAFFNAFKFPDEMDLMIECNVELCKTDCDMCTLAQSLEPAKRKRRDIYLPSNETIGEPVRIGRGIKVIVPEDLALEQPIGLCMSYVSFVWGALFILFVLFVSCISAACMWLKLQRHPNKK